jgi:hypothetical protein
MQFATKSTLLGEFRFGAEDNIKTDRTEVGFEGVDWMNVVQDKGKC